MVSWACGLIGAGAMSRASSPLTTSDSVAPETSAGWNTGEGCASIRVRKPVQRGGRERRLRLVRRRGG